MTIQDIKCQINVSASPSEAFAAISQVQKWWAESFDGKAASVGDTFHISFGETYMNFVVTESLAGSHLAWKVKDCFLAGQKNSAEWTNTSVVFDLKATEKGTSVVLVHHGLVPGLECYEDCTKGWNYFMGSLAELLATGSGTPATAADACAANR